MQFIDEALITVAAGDGGDGCCAFLREKYRPHGGPAGGDGGDGGNVVLETDEGLNTLLSFKRARTFRAARGEAGRGKSQHGRCGQDLVLRVPVGTLVSDSQTREPIADLDRPDMQVTIATGGRGGAGNARFVSSTNQAPRRADPGQPGQTLHLRLELKLLADCGLIGLPNAGKSSLLRRLSAAKPKVADYPFSTLEPALGVVRLDEEHSFVMADIPGLIEGAHEGAGLGTRFLKHVSRTGVLVHLIDSSGRDAEQCTRDFDTVNQELSRYSSELASKPQLTVATKIDLPDVREHLPRLREAFDARGISLAAVSSATGEGCDELVASIASAMRHRDSYIEGGLD